MLVPGIAILDAAVKGKWATPALNVNEMLQLQAYLHAAYENRSPVILQCSMGSREFTGWMPRGKADPDLGARVSVDMIGTFDREYARAYGYQVPVAIILDHGPNPAQCKGAVDSGFTMVMIDGSIDYSQKDSKGKHPVNSFEANVSVSKAVVDYAHRKGVTVETELGTLGGIEDATAASKVQLTNPDQAGRFMTETGADCLAVAIGTSHGAYKFAVQPKLAIDLVPKIALATGYKPLVMHGSSSVPADLVAQINQFPVIKVADGKITVSGYFGGQLYRGDIAERQPRVYSLSSPTDMAQFGIDMAGFSCLKKSMGVPMDQIQQAISFGVAKVNVDTDGRLATTGRIRETMASKPDVFDQRAYFSAARQALFDVAVEKMKGFGSAGKADAVEIITLDDMVRRYGFAKPEEPAPSTT